MSQQILHNYMLAQLWLKISQCVSAVFAICLAEALDPWLPIGSRAHSWDSGQTEWKHRLGLCWVHIFYMLCFSWAQIIWYACIFTSKNFSKWARARQNQQNHMCVPQRLRSVWASAKFDQSSLSAWRNHRSLATYWAYSEDSDQTGRMPRLTWVIAGRMIFCWFCHAPAQMFQGEIDEPGHKKTCLQHCGTRLGSNRPTQ